MLEKFRFNRVGLDEEKSGNMLEKLKWGAGGRRFKSSRPDQIKQVLSLEFSPRLSAFLLSEGRLKPPPLGGQIYR